MAQYIKYELKPETNFNDLYELDSSFSGTTIYDPYNDIYYGYYNDTANLTNLPDWAILISEDEYNAVVPFLISKAKEECKQDIEIHGKKKIEEKYLEINQLHIDTTYAQNAIPGLCGDGRHSDDVILHAVTVLGDPITLEDLNLGESNIKNKELDFSSYIPSDITDQSVIDSIINYYYTVCEGIIVYRKRRLVLDWIQQKQKYIDSLSDSEWQTLAQDPMYFENLISDCPEI